MHARRLTSGAPPDPVAAPSTVPVAAPADPRCRPVPMEFMHSIGPSTRERAYSLEEHGTWAMLVSNQAPILANSACRMFLDGLRNLDLAASVIPRIADVDRQLRSRTGWRLARSPGVLDAEDLFLLLSERVFPCVEAIRPRRELDFSPVPDVFHGLFACAPMLTVPEYGDFLQRVARAGLAAGAEVRARIERFYRSTIEFGLIVEQGRARMFGQGLLSSSEEARRCLSFDVERRRFSLPLARELTRDPSDLQRQVFVLESFERLVETFDAWLGDEGLP